MRKTFTLIELLVVIAIIAVLAAMLLPTLNKARATALATSCMNNAKEISAVFQSYINDNDDFTVSNPTTTEANLAPYKPYGVAIYAYNLWDNKDNTTKFRKASNVCPTAKPMALYSIYGSGIKRVENESHCFGVNNYIITSYGLNGTYYEKKINLLRPESVAIAEAAHAYGVGSGSLSTYSEIFQYHGGKTTIGFVDGHVESWNMATRSKEYDTVNSKFECDK